MWVFPNFIQPLFNKFKELEEGDLKNGIINLAKRLEFPLKKIYEMDQSQRSAHSNAYLFGFWKNKRIVLFDTLIKNLENKEIESCLAHELGHLIMHIEKTPRSVETVEDEADIFASEFLMPENEIAPLLHELDLPVLAQLKRRWRVSMRALIRRAKDVGAINQDAYRRFQILFSKKGYNKNEPVMLPVEQPTLLSETLDLYKSELGYSDYDLMQIMRIGQKDYNFYHPKVSEYL